MKSKFYFAANTGFLIFHVPEPAGAFPFNPGILSVRLLLVCAEINIAEMLIVFDFRMVFQ